jgi:hypothetical protein
LGNLCASVGGIFTEAAVARMDEIIATDGLTVTMEAMLNHPVLKKDEISFPTGYEPDQVIQRGLDLLWKMADCRHAPGYEERRVTLRKAGVLGVLPPVVAAFTEAEIEAGMHPDAKVWNHKVKSSYLVGIALIGMDRLKACMKGEDPLSDMLTEEDMMVLVGTMKKQGFVALATAAAGAH